MLDEHPSGLLALLTPEQRERALAYAGEDDLGPAKLEEAFDMAYSPQLMGSIFVDVQFLGPDQELPRFSRGDRVQKHTGDYQLEGTVVGVMWTRRGRCRYAVEHDAGFIHIYTATNLRAVVAEAVTITVGG